MKSSGNPRDAGIVEGRIPYLDVARVVAVASMVLLHAAMNKVLTLPVASSGWRAGNVYDSMARFCVPLFLMISGALFLRPGKEIPLGRLYGRHILRIATAFVFWSVAYALFATWWRARFYGESSGALGFLNLCVQGHHHLWFLHVIAGLYMIVPFLKKITADKRLAEYFLLLALVFAVVIPTLAGSLPALALPLQTVAPNVDFAAAAPKNMQLYFVLGYPFYFVAGVYLHQHTLPPWARRAVYALGAAG
ncbi:MAG: acyltransferase family protein, partial [Kiritimatiellaeota bacterium]|nr:acyltransferase family protein [Kiritimatiellota bacterium]